MVAPRKESLDELIGQVTDLCIEFVESHGDFSEENAMDALAIVIGGWIAAFHQHWLPSNRRKTVGRFGVVIEKAMEHAWKQLHTNSADVEAGL